MRNKKFDVDKFAEEDSISDIDELFFDEEGPKRRINAKCPKCGSVDWWEVKRNSKGKILYCSECPNE